MKYVILILDCYKVFVSFSYFGYDFGSVFNNKSNIYWFLNGWYDRGVGEDFIGYEFFEFVVINLVCIVY